MLLRRWRRVAMVSMLGLSLLTAGCSDNPREPGGGGKASGTESGAGAVTTASPGGGNVQPNEGTNAGVR
jgi:hypothetical protein